MGVAFFDLDLTLLGVNSGTLWVKKELREGSISRWQFLRALSWIARYQLGFAEMEDALLKAISSLEGKEEASTRARTHQFYDEEVRDLYRPGAREALEGHRRRGDTLVLLTSSSNYLSERVVAELALDDYLCTRFEVDAAGRYTGRPLGPLCYGRGKLVHATGFAEARGVALADCTFYTDSASDLPVMEAVGRPVAVNPDPRLRRVAAARGWASEDWGAVRGGRRP